MPASPDMDAAHWQHRLEELTERYHVPGAVLGLLRLGERAGGGASDERVTVAAGVLNRATEVSATPDSLFHIGSITKVWTATLVMQLVDEGLLALDAPLRAVLPALRLSDQALAERVTMRHLLCHTSGIDGDFMPDTGRGDDCLKRFVAEVVPAPVVHPLGAMFSYSNSGFSLAGRVIEELTGDTWDAAVRTRLVARLGLEHAVTLPEEALRHRTALGHFTTGAAPTPAPTWQLPRSWGPAGTVSASAGDLLTFATLHLRGGTTLDGRRVLSASSTAAMCDHHVAVPPSSSAADSWGLGWARFDGDGVRLIGHNGGARGQSAYLRLLPARGVAAALLTNGGATTDLSYELLNEVFAELAGVRLPSPPEPAGVLPPPEAARHVGTYRRTGCFIEIGQRRDGRLTLRDTPTDGFEQFSSTSTEELDLEWVRDDIFAARTASARYWEPMVFRRLPTGQRYLYRGSRATPMIMPPP
jgi:CubicO group peptidase (beta-lactamase class C family)